ncbi:MAG TPA: hypothetical protein VMD99_02230 [Terriglobales bacterium]|nr:hypothetical protein [Terriglobales bacterium]
MPGRVPGPYGSHQHHRHHHPQVYHHHAGSQIHGAAALQGATLPQSGAGARPSFQQAAFKIPTAPGYSVRFTKTYTGAFACEAWKNKSQLRPPPLLAKRADPSKNDSWYRVGDILASAVKIEKRDLSAFGFTESGTDPFTALLFFLLDIGTDDEYRVLFRISQIHPDSDDPWKGGVRLQRSILAGSTILPCPRQYDADENMVEFLNMQDWAAGMAFVGKVLEGFSEIVMNFLWALTGGWETKIVGEQVESYVKHQVLSVSLKYIKKDFHKVVRVYVEGFMAELVVQCFKQLLIAVRMQASDKLMTSVPAGGDTITVEQIHLVQSSSNLAQATRQVGIKWAECHKKGMEKALMPFFALFPPRVRAAAALQRFLNACWEHIGKFFFDLGLKSAFEEGADKLGESIPKLISDVVTEWAVKALGESPKGVSEQEAGFKLKDLTVRKLTDGTMIQLAIQYLGDNWERLAKSALEEGEKKLVKAMAHGTGGAIPL